MTQEEFVRMQQAATERVREMQKRAKANIERTNQRTPISLNYDTNITNISPQNNKPPVTNIQPKDPRPEDAPGYVHIDNGRYMSMPHFVTAPAIEEPSAIDIAYDPEPSYSDGKDDYHSDNEIEYIPAAEFPEYSDKSAAIEQEFEYDEECADIDAEIDTECTADINYHPVYIPANTGYPTAGADYPAEYVTVDDDQKCQYALKCNKRGIAGFLTQKDNILILGILILLMSEGADELLLLALLYIMM